MDCITVSNLFPRPDQPNRGLFNGQLFRELAKVVSTSHQAPALHRYQNICLVPEWRLWRWRAIRRWCCPDETLPETRYLPVFYLPYIGRSLNWWFCYRALGTYWRGRMSVTAPVFLASWLYPDAVACARLARELGAAVWLRVHGTDRFHLRNPVRRRTILDACDTAQGVLCNCAAMARDLVAAGVPEPKIRVVPNGVDGNRFRFRERNAAWNELTECAAHAQRPLPNTLSRALSGGHRVVLFVGNLVPIKGPDVMLEAFAAFRKQSDRNAHAFRSEAGDQANTAANVQLAFIGSGPMRAQLASRAAELGLSRQVSFLGALPHAEVALWMNVADVLCLTSRSEGMPNVVLEALVSGLPVVATDVGGCGELLEGEAAAKVCPVGDVDEVSRGIGAMLAAAVERPALARRNVGRFSWQRQAQVMWDLLSRPASGSAPRDGTSS